MAGRRRGTGSRVRRRKSRDSCDSDAFARPRARRALTGLQGLDARPCPTPPGPSAGSVAGSCAALVTVCCGRKVALFTSLHGGHVVWSNCDFRVLSGPGELYHVPRACTDTAERSEQLFPDWAESSTPDFGLSVPLVGWFWVWGQHLGLGTGRDSGKIVVCARLTAKMKDRGLAIIYTPRTCAGMAT